MSEKNFDFESLGDPADVAASLRRIAEGMEKGRLILEGEEGELLLQPGSLIKVAIKAKHAPDKGKVKIKLSWSKPSEEAGSF